MSSKVPAEYRTDARCLVEAAAWRVHLSEGGLEHSPEFEQWLESDPRNEAAWDRIQVPLKFISEHEASPETLQWRRVALANAQQAASVRWLEPVRVRRTRVWAVAAAVALLGCAALMAAYLQRPEMYRTQIGERRSVLLADGSHVELDSATELQVRYSNHARELTLNRGQARFDVAHDIERPFCVTAGAEKVVAMGTAFNVDLSGSKLVVTLIEGRVVVLPKRAGLSFTTLFSPDDLPLPAAHPSAGRAQRGIELNAGQRLEVSVNGKASDIAPANLERSNAWQNGQLIFDDAPLSVVVEQVNRYARRPLVLQDEDAGRERVSGVFSTDDVDGFVDTLTRYLPIDADVRDGAIYLSHR
jgi:transmembrane sensor